MRDLYSNLGAVNLLDPQDTADTDTATAWLDTKNFEGALLIAHVGTITGVDASNYVTPVLQESDTTAAADATAVAAADMIGAFTKIDATSEDSVVQAVGYKGSKRYVRINFDWTGTAVTAALVGAVGIVGLGRTNPVTAPAAVAAT